MDQVSILLRKPPYGCADASEAIRHALGGDANDVSVNLILLDGGVNTARKDQNIEGTKYASMESGISDCIDFGVIVYADKDSLNAQNLPESDLIAGIKVAGPKEIAELLKASYLTLIF
jgi:sulfur relay (sulfurtransferase) DsrF/TusC family protein